MQTPTAQLHKPSRQVHLSACDATVAKSSHSVGFPPVLLTSIFLRFYLWQATPQNYHILGNNSNSYRYVKISMWDIFIANTDRVIISCAHQELSGTIHKLFLVLNEGLQKIQYCLSINTSSKTAQSWKSLLNMKTFTNNNKTLLLPKKILSSTKSTHWQGVQAKEYSSRDYGYHYTITTICIIPQWVHTRILHHNAQQTPVQKSNKYKT